MLNIELAILQTIEEDEWWTAGEISAKTNVIEPFTEETLKNLYISGVVEARQTKDTDGRSNVIKWRGKDEAVSNYLKRGIPCY